MPSMGPPPFGSGNGLTAIHVAGAQIFLQWGHRLSAVETSRKGRVSFFLMYLQWGHRLSAVETQLPGVQYPAPVPPSMGPPPFGSGNTLHQPPRTDSPSIHLQWGHRLSAVETMVRLRKWGGSTPTFNGATAFRQWKLGPDNPDQHLYLLPFNGATAFRQWKLGISLQQYMVDSYLQWGHRLSAVETHLEAQGAIPLRIPSMGPPPFGSGNNSFCTVNWSFRASLQWGHRLSAVETTWATRPPCWSAPSFNGATAFRQWKRHGPTAGGVSSSPFNGATAFRQWKRFWRRNLATPSSSLQWGHRLSAVETGEVHRDVSYEPFILQWGHRLSAVETPIPLPSLSLLLVLQWGHRLSAVETWLLTSEAW